MSTKSKSGRSKTDESANVKPGVGRLRYPLLALATEPDLAPFWKEHPPRNFTGYRAAKASAENAWGLLTSSVVEQTPLPLDQPLMGKPGARKRNERSFAALVMYYMNDGRWLNGCALHVMDAVSAGDESFFLQLADTIRKRPTYRGRSLLAQGLGLIQKDDPRPKKRQTEDFRHLIVDHWIAWALWLMPDPVAASFVSKYAGAEITAGSFTKVRQGLGLVQHPKHPVRSFSTTGTPLLAEGWKNAKT